MSSAEQKYRVGWIVDSAPQRAWSFPWQSLGPVSRIRYDGLARWLGEHDSAFRMERFLPWRRYDAVVIIKKVNAPVLNLACRLQNEGTKIIFDSNVNYYEDWGDYQIPGTKPLPQQMELAAHLTRMADGVIADSSYLADLCRKLNPKTAMIPDAVDIDLYRPKAEKGDSPKLRLIWSGIRKKAHHLQLIESVLIALREHLSLHLVVNPPHPKDPPSPVIERLSNALAARVTTFSANGFAHDLQQADVIISPKILSSAYEMSHTEYKISLGMAVGLPALASPQRSYEEAIGSQDGGQICRSESEWSEALKTMHADPAHRQELGRRARQRVERQYAIPILARRYGEFLRQVLS